MDPTLVNAAAVWVPSTVAHDLTEKDGTDGTDQVEVSAPEVRSLGIAMCWEKVER